MTRRVTAASRDAQRDQDLGGVSRRSRYVRDPDAGTPTLTPPRLGLLMAVADYGLLSLPQAARLSGRSAKSVQRGLRPLFDAGLVDVVALPRAALAEPGGANDASLLFGSAPNVYAPTKAGLRLLRDHGLIEEGRAVPRYGPQNALFLRHELGVRDVRIWLELSARGQAGQALAVWRDGPEAAIDLRRVRPPGWARPDAWFVYRLGDRVLVGLVEYDRGTERGDTRWREKLACYGALFSGARLRETTGYENARVLVIAPDARRRDRLADILGRHAPGGLAERFWLTERAVLDGVSLSGVGWRQTGDAQTLRPLVPPALLGGATGA